MKEKGETHAEGKKKKKRGGAPQVPAEKNKLP